MMDFKSLVFKRRVQAFAGAAGLHFLAGAVLLTWRPAPLPAGPETIPVLLVELPASEAATESVVEVVEEDEPEPDRLQDPEPTPLYRPDEEPLPLPVEAPPDPERSEEREERRLSEEEIRSLVQADPAPPAGVSLAQAGEDKSEQSKASVKDIPPQFVYTYDPFAETAPTALARVTRAINCSRANRETRPAFCPNYNEDDVYLATLTQNRPSGWEQASYDPVLDIAAARSALGNFSAAQAKPAFNGRSESFGRTHPHDPVLPDKDCQRVAYGFSDPGQLDRGAAVPDNTAVFCAQSLHD